MTTPINRVLSGMRPTGRLHIGHYFGALQNWVRLQSDPAYECFYFVADWHALTSDYADTSAIAENSLQITIDFLAAGLDPAKSTIFLQSFVPEHAELHLLSKHGHPPRLARTHPHLQRTIENVTNKDLHTYGFLGYPTLQTADIVMYGEADRDRSLVPVGEDQVSHVEFSREIVRRFVLYYGFNVDQDLYSIANRKLGRSLLLKILEIPAAEPIVPANAELTPEQKTVVTGLIRQRVHEIGISNFFEKLPADAKKFFSFQHVLTEPEALLTPTPRIPGLDGRKMSKCYGNAITLSESDDDIRKKTKVMVTDPARKRRTDPGNPDVCPVFDWHKLFSTEDRDPGRLQWVREGCTTAGIGCIDCKSAMAENLIKWIAPVRERRVHYETNQEGVLKILDEGSAKARESAKLTMARVRDSIFHWPQKRTL